MSKRKLMEVVSVAFGFYCLIWFIKSIPSVGMAFVMKESGFITSQIQYALLLSIFPILNLVLAYLFLCKTHFIVTLFTLGEIEPINHEEKTGETQYVYTDLSFWIKIMGLYYLVSSASIFISRLGTIAIRLSEGWSLAYDPLLPQAFILIFSLIFIFRSKRVEDFIRRKSK